MAFGVANGVVVAAASDQYVKTAPVPVLPAVTAAAVMSTVNGEQTAAGAVMVKTGVVFIVTTTGLISVQVPRVLLI